MNGNGNFSGIETGPVRPPDESESLLIRVTRNCSWNRCGFCGLYRGEPFSIRKKEDIFKEADIIKKCLDVFLQNERRSDYDKLQAQYKLQQDLEAKGAINAYQIAFDWYRNGMKSIFLQDSDPLAVKTGDLTEIVKYLKNSFPQETRIASYAGPRTLLGKSGPELSAIRKAGLDRIHTGVESGSDEILGFVNKGADKKAHVEAGRKVKKAGFELSVYYVPGLGGSLRWAENALETADAVNQINPDYIRIRTLAVPDRVPLSRDCAAGRFIPANDVQVIKELKLFFESLGDVTSVIASDHILNLIPAAEGRLPRDRKSILKELEWFLNLSDYNQMVFRIGRRTGQIFSKEDFGKPEVAERVEEMIRRNHIGLQNADRIIGELMKHFI